MPGQVGKLAHGSTIRGGDFDVPGRWLPHPVRSQELTTFPASTDPESARLPLTLCTHDLLKLLLRIATDRSCLGHSTRLADSQET